VGCGWRQRREREGGKEVELNFEEADLFSVSSSMPPPDFFPDFSHDKKVVEQLTDSSTRLLESARKPGRTGSNLKEASSTFSSSLLAPLLSFPSSHFLEINERGKKQRIIDRFHKIE